MYIWCNVPIVIEPDILSAMMQVDAMINGRRRDHGAERAHLEVCLLEPSSLYASQGSCY